MVLPPVPPPTATPPATTTTTATTAPAARLCCRAGRCGNRGGQRSDADGRSDRRSHRADAPKHRNRNSCDGLSQQPARCQKTLHHSAHPSFLSSHLHLKAGGMRDLRVDSAATDNAHSGGVVPCALSHTSASGKITEDPYLGIQSPRVCRSSRGHRLSIRMAADFAKAKMAETGVISVNGSAADDDC